MNKSYLDIIHINLGRACFNGFQLSNASQINLKNMKFNACCKNTLFFGEESGNSFAVNKNSGKVLLTFIEFMELLQFFQTAILFLRRQQEL